MMGERLGKYILDGLIAEGGMAKIYRARTEGIGGVDRVVALKCLHEEVAEDSNTEHMLIDEARITVRMTHKNICQTYGLEHVNRRYFMVMEYIDGINLSQLLQWFSFHNQPFPIEAAVFIAMEISAGLSYVHRMLDDGGESLGLIHRDVNPQNICLSKEGDVKLIDFGIAKARVMSQETQAGTIKGKFNYMSPEQGRGERIDQRSDIFSLAAVLYEMLAGQMLYPLSLDDRSLRQNVQMAKFTPIEHLRTDIPPMLRQILAKALTRNINQRFATARDFLIALSQFSHSANVFDALNLSALVQSYLSSREVIAKTPQAVHGQNASDPSLPPSPPQQAAISAHARANPSTRLEDSPTDIYSGAAFHAYAAAQMPQGLSPQFEVDRHVDLELENRSSDATQMIAAPQADNYSSDETSFFTALMSKLMQISERQLIYLVLALSAILALSVAIFFSLDQSESTAKPIHLANETPTTRQIYVESIPSGAQLIVDGQMIATRTPTSLPAQGKLVVRHQFYDDQALDLSTLRAQNIRLELKPKMGRVNIDSTPSRAEVTIDGQFFGQTPLSSLLEMHKTHTIELNVKGYKSQQRTLTWEDENLRSQNIDVVLVRKDKIGNK